MLFLCMMILGAGKEQSHRQWNCLCQESYNYKQFANRQLQPGPGFVWYKIMAATMPMQHVLVLLQARTEPRGVHSRFKNKRRVNLHSVQAIEKDALRKGRSCEVFKLRPNLNLLLIEHVDADEISKPPYAQVEQSVAGIIHRQRTICPLQYEYDRPPSERDSIHQDNQE